MTVHRNRPTGADEAGQMEVKTVEQIQKQSRRVLWRALEICSGFAQQQIISSQRPNVRPESLLKQVARDAQSGARIPAFRMNLGNRTLFEEKNGSK